MVITHLKMYFQNFYVVYDVLYCFQIIVPVKAGYWFNKIHNSQIVINIIVYLYQLTLLCTVERNQSAHWKW